MTCQRRAGQSARSCNCIGKSTGCSDDAFRGFGFPALNMPQWPSDWSGMLKPAPTSVKPTSSTRLPRSARCRGEGHPDHPRQRRADGAWREAPEQEKKEGGFHRVERSYGSFQRAWNPPDDANRDSIKASFKNGCSRSRSTSARSVRRSRDARSRSTADVAGLVRHKKNPARDERSRLAMPRRPQPCQPSQEHPAWPENNAGLRPTRHRAGGSQSQRSSQHHAVVRRPLPAISAPAKSAPFRRWKPCSVRAAACSRTSSAVTSSASATTRRQLPPIPMTWSMPRLASPPPQVRCAAPSRQWAGQPHQRTVGSLVAGGRQTRCRIWPLRGGYRTSAAGAGRQRRGQDHPGSVQDQGR